MAQWYPHKRNSKVWPGLVTKEKTMKYPTSAMCTVCVSALGVRVLPKLSVDIFFLRACKIPEYTVSKVETTCGDNM